MGRGVPGEWVPPLKGVSDFVIKQSDVKRFNNGYYNDTKKEMVVKAIVERYESIDIIGKGQDIMGAGLGGLKKIKN